MAKKTDQPDQLISLVGSIDTVPRHTNPAEPQDMNKSFSPPVFQDVSTKNLTGASNKSDVGSNFKFAKVTNVPRNFFQRNISGGQKPSPDKLSGNDLDDMYLTNATTSNDSQCPEVKLVGSQTSISTKENSSNFSSSEKLLSNTQSNEKLVPSGKFYENITISTHPIATKDVDEIGKVHKKEESKINRRKPALRFATPLLDIVGASDRPNKTPPSANLTAHLLSNEKSQSRQTKPLSDLSKSTLAQKETILVDVLKNLPPQTSLKENISAANPMEQFSTMSKPLFENQDANRLTRNPERINKVNEIASESSPLRVRSSIEPNIKHQPANTEKTIGNSNGNFGVSSSSMSMFMNFMSWKCHQEDQLNKSLQDKERERHRLEVAELVETKQNLMVELASLSQAHKNVVKDLEQVRSNQLENRKKYEEELIKSKKIADFASEFQLDLTKIRAEYSELKHRYEELFTEKNSLVRENTRAIDNLEQQAGAISKLKLLASECMTRAKREIEEWQKKALVNEAALKEKSMALKTFQDNQNTLEEKLATNERLMEKMMGELVHGFTETRQKFDKAMEDIDKKVDSGTVHEVASGLGQLIESLKLVQTGANEKFWPVIQGMSTSLEKLPLDLTRLYETRKACPGCNEILVIKDQLVELQKCLIDNQGLQEKLSEAKSQISALQSQIQAKEEEIAECNATKVVGSQREVELLLQINGMQKKISEAQTRESILGQRLEELKVCEIELNESRIELAKVQLMGEEDKKRLKVLEEGIDSLKCEKGELEASASKVKEEFERTKECLNQAINERNKLKQEHENELDNMRNKLSREANRLRQEQAAEFENKIYKMMQQNKMMESRYEEKIVEIQQQINEVDTLLDIKTKEGCGNGKTIDMIENSTEIGIRLKRIFEGYSTAKLEAEKEWMDKLEMEKQQSTELVQRVEQLRSVIQGMDSHGKEQVRRLKEQEERNRNLEGSLEKERVNSEEKRREAEKLMDEFKTRIIKSEMEARCAIENKLNEAKKDLNELSTALSECRINLAQVTMEKNEYEEQKKRMEEELTKLGSEMTSVRMEVQSQLQERESRIKALEDETRQYKNQQRIYEALKTDNFNATVNKKVNDETAKSGPDLRDETRDTPSKDETKEGPGRIGKCVEELLESTDASVAAFSEFIDESCCLPETGSVDIVYETERVNSDFSTQRNGRGVDRGEEEVATITEGGEIEYADGLKLPSFAAFNKTIESLSSSQDSVLSEPENLSSLPADKLDDAVDLVREKFGVVEQRNRESVECRPNLKILPETKHDLTKQSGLFKADGTNKSQLRLTMSSSPQQDTDVYGSVGCVGKSSKGGGKLETDETGYNNDTEKVTGAGQIGNRKPNQRIVRSLTVRRQAGISDVTTSGRHLQNISRTLGFVAQPLGGKRMTSNGVTNVVGAGSRSGNGSENVSVDVTKKRVESPSPVQGNVNGAVYTSGSGPTTKRIRLAAKTSVSGARHTDVDLRSAHTADKGGNKQATLSGKANEECTSVNGRRSSVISEEISQHLHQRNILSVAATPSTERRSRVTKSQRYAERFSRATTTAHTPVT